MQQSKERRGIFDDLSINMVLVSALAAGTSFFLTSKIGLTGSLVGAVFAAVVSTTATQVYKGVIAASTETIKDVVVAREEDSNLVPNRRRHLARPEVAPTGEASRMALTKRLIVFGVVVSLICVAISAAVVYVSTRGEGLGPTSVQELVTPQETANESQEKADASASADAKDKKTQQNEKTDATNPVTNTDEKTDASQETPEGSNTPDTGIDSEGTVDDGTDSTVSDDVNSNNGADSGSSESSGSDETAGTTPSVGENAGTSA